MELQTDFKELLELFNAHGVDYLIVGGYALAFHGAPRYTGDIDLLVEPVPENARRVIAALTEFGFGSVGLTAADLEQPEQVIQLGMPPVRVDIITSVTGVSWAKAWEGKEPGRYGGLPVYYLGRDQLLTNKRATGRAKDLADIEALGEE